MMECWKASQASATWTTLSAAAPGVLATTCNPPAYSPPSPPSSSRPPAGTPALMPTSWPTRAEVVDERLAVRQPIVQAELEARAARGASRTGASRPRAAGPARRRVGAPRPDGQGRRPQVLGDMVRALHRRRGQGRGLRDPRLPHHLLPGPGRPDPVQARGVRGRRVRAPDGHSDRCVAAEWRRDVNSALHNAIQTCHRCLAGHHCPEHSGGQRAVSAKWMRARPRASAHPASEPPTGTSHTLSRTLRERLDANRHPRRRRFT